MRVLDVATLAQWVEAAPVNDSAQVGPDVVIDTRKVTPGALFIALPGTRVDGHDFTQAAQDTGAAAVLVTRRTDAQLPISLLTMVKPAYLDWRVMSWRLNENVACVPSL